MRRWIFLLLALVLQSGCPLSEPCFVSPVDVTARIDAPDLGSSVRVIATAHGESCGCCGGKSPSTIVLYEWDEGEDGSVEKSGATATEYELVRPVSGSTRVSVRVTDSRGQTDTATVSVPAS